MLVSDGSENDAKICFDRETRKTTRTGSAAHRDSNDCAGRLVDVNGTRVGVCVDGRLRLDDNGGAERHVRAIDGYSTT